jgi:hypothetical protein
MKDLFNHKIEIDFKNLDNLVILSNYIKQLTTERDYYKKVAEKFAPLFKITTEKLDK